MPADLAHYAAPILAFLATYLLHSTCLLAGVWLYFCWHRTARPALRSLLWKIGATAAFVTAPLALWLPAALPHSDINTPAAEHPTIADAPTMRSREIQPNIPAENDGFVTPSVAPDHIPAFEAWNDIAPAGDAEAFEYAPAETITPIPAATGIRPRAVAAKITRPPVHWEPQTVIAVSLAAAGCFLLALTRVCGQTVWLRRRFADCRLLTDGPAAEELAGLMTQQRRGKSIRLLSSGRYAEPAAFGVWRWHIVLPDRAEAELTREELRSLLAHELAHLVRRDIWWLCIGRLLCTAFAYQPLNFWARRQWQRAAEFLCDEWAVQHTGDRFALANCLTTVAGWRIGAKTWTGSLAATGHHSTLSERVENLVNHPTEQRPTSRLGSLWLAVLVVVVAVGLITHGPTATFALPAVDPPSDKPDAALSTADEASDAEMITEDAFVEFPIIESNGNDAASLRGELAALREELLELEALFARSGVDGRLKQYPAQIRRRIAAIETKLDIIKNQTSTTPSAPGSAGGANDNQQPHPETETDSNPLAHF